MNRKTGALAVASPGSSVASIDGSVVNVVLSARQAGLRQRARNARRASMDCLQNLTRGPRVIDFVWRSPAGKWRK